MKQSSLSRERALPTKERYRRLAEINRAITTSLNLDKVVDLILDNTSQLVGSRVTALLLVDGDGKLRIRAARGVDPALVKSFSASFEEEVTRDLQRSLAVTPEETLFSVPVIAKNSKDGLLVIVREAELTDDEEWQLSALADSAGIAITNARLHEYQLAKADQKRDETFQALSESNEKINRILESITDLFYSLDYGWRFVDVNRQTETRFGKSRSDLIGNVIWDIYPHAVDSPLFPELHKCMDERVPVHFELASRIVPDVWFEVHGYPSDEGITVYLRDISERRQAEITNQLLAAIVESSEDAIISKDLNGTILSWNSGAQRIFGYTAEEAVGQPITLIIPHDRLGEEPKILNRIRNGESVDHYDTIRRHKNGSLIDISLSVSPVRDRDGKIIGASKIARDISERKRAEQERVLLLEREQAARSEAEQANRLKDEFFATLSHELRNPLNVILGYAEVLLRSEEAKHSQFVQNVGTTLKRNAIAQSQLVRDLLDLSRLRMGKLSLNLEPVSLTETISNAIETVQSEATAKDIKLDVVTPEEILFVDADPLRMEQVVWNLLNNAVKFTPRGGSVLVRLSRQEDQAVLRIEDTGQGIEKDFLPHVFEIFRQADASNSRKHGGMGIGLALVERLIALHDGSVEVASEGLGRGAQFTIKVPLIQQAKGSSSTRKQSVGGILSDMRILVVDDNVDTIEMLRRLFEMDGAIVETAANGRQALEIAGKDRFDVILTDISMPGMDGFEMLRLLRALPGHTDVPIVAITGFGRTQDVERAEGEGFFSHITKPIDVDALFEVLQSVPLNNRKITAKPGTN